MQVALDMQNIQHILMTIKGPFYKKQLKYLYSIVIKTNSNPY